MDGGTWLKHLQFIHSCDKYLLNSGHVFRNSEELSEIWQ